MSRGAAHHAARPERVGIVAYTNVAPLNWGLEPWPSNGGMAEFVRDVPTVLNAALDTGEIDLTLVSSIEFIRNRHRYKALADETPGVWFVGRLATYKYYNMDQVVAQALTTYAKLVPKKVPAGV